MKPGARSEITNSVWKKTKKLNAVVIIKKEIKIIEKKISVADLDLALWSKYKGIKTLFIAPSANILLNKFGNLKANIKASERADAPKKLANKTSLNIPVILDKRIFELIFDKLLSFMFSIKLKEVD